MLYFVEVLTLRTWFLKILPGLIWIRLRGRPVPERCYVLEGAASVLKAASLTGRLVHVPVELLEYRLLDIKDESGLLVDIRIRHEDLKEVQDDALKSPLFRELINVDASSPRLSAFVAKALSGTDYKRRGTLHRLILAIQITAWKARRLGARRNSQIVLFAERRHFMDSASRYAQRFGISVVDVHPAFDIVRIAQRLLRPGHIALVRILRNRLYQLRLGLNTTVPPKAHARIGTDYQGQLNLDQAHQFSDLFFLQQSSLSGRDILLTFGIPFDPLDKTKSDELATRGITALAVHPKATVVRSVPVFNQTTAFTPCEIKFPTARSARDRLDQRWVRYQTENYFVERDYWTQLFGKHNVKVWVSWYRYDERHSAIADAMERLGGVTAIYQRGWQPNPSSATAVHADIMFGYTQADAEMERLSGSSIPYHVAVGFIGDHRFPLLRARAQEVRNYVMSNGARFVAAYFDEGSSDDEKLSYGHVITLENYQYLLEKLLENPWLGLVIKPKTPSNLYRRLGPVGELLQEAERTGRCYVFKAGPHKGVIPPSAASLAADVAIHGHLVAGTAGLEAALTGVPTLLIDREGWKASSLYRLGEGRVVFADCRELWEALMKYRAGSASVHGFGDWSPMLPELDPFRDGRAAERVGTYLQWLIEGHKSGQDRDTILADAAERYCERWGDDKITALNSRRTVFQNS